MRKKKSSHSNSHLIGSAVVGNEVDKSNCQLYNKLQDFNEIMTTKTNQLRRKCGHAVEVISSSTIQMRENLISITRSICARNSRSSSISISKKETCSHNTMTRGNSFYRRSPIISLVAIISLLLAITTICATTFVLAAGASPPTLRRQPPVAQKRMGGLDPSDYVDEAGELDIMANQQQIPTAKLMSAAGHFVPENFFLPGGSIPSQITAARYAAAAAGQPHQMDPMQQVGSHVHARHVAPRQQEQQQQQHQHHQSQQPPTSSSATANRYQQMVDLHENQQLIDYNNYNHAVQPDPRDSALQTSLAEFLASNNQPVVPMFESNNQQQMMALAEHHLAARLAALHHQRVQQQEPMNSQASENAGDTYGLPTAGNPNIGPEYQIAAQESAANYGGGYEHQSAAAAAGQQLFGQPTKSGGRFSEGIIRPFGDVQGFSSPVLNSALSAIPKTPNVDNLVNQIPPMQTPTVLSFSSAVDPMIKVKAVNQKTRNVMKQAEQMARATLKVINGKFGTTFGEEQQEPIILNPNGPLGFVNYLIDPGLFLAALNSAEKSYQSDNLPAPIKAGLRPVLNIFRVPNKKRDKANLLNLFGAFASGAGLSGTKPDSGVVRHNTKDTKKSVS